MTIKSGFVAIIGRPNVGKSTLLNTILNNKVAIVTAKAQTTRNRIQGIYNDNEAQIVFMDTPGIHKAHHEMGKFMNKVALSTTKAADVILFLAPVNEHIGDNDRYIIKALQERGVPIVLVVTKIDLVSKGELMVKIAEWEKVHNFTAVIPISALKHENVPQLLTLLKDHLTEGPQYYPDDMLTDQPEKFLIREIIREKILLLTEDEIPHSVAILIDKIEEQPTLLKIMASICVERDSQKGIVIGKNGRLIKEIGTQARLELEQILGTKIFLELFVKVVEKWRDKPSMIARLGYNKESY
ncbi:MAG: GTPase Era [Spiroplasma poulsonii]|uniref:GTPase Era n=1 Tax=Spiroplasma poulsonii TaxID=2138 RepID=A0A2P6FF98_9MOLU|nr:MULTISPECIES: GTPase Era [Spiroplasma]KAF0850245.1 GTPase Era [Spiroplasma poulsonii]MBH8622673.1 GTPase Era [Spiroplasma sp. hyd1]MBW1241901.1 GTPase Era [Spiroplasma poulsonii]PQM32130.1 GTPase Era [Spiroplasma poulsonii]PWF94777.1 GTPase Era [Spiroplasma poulsonii]